MCDRRLISFNRIMCRIPWDERSVFVLKLRNLDSIGRIASESLSYKKEELMLRIYQSIKGHPLMEYTSFSMIDKKSIENYQFSKEIMCAIDGYLQAPIDKRKLLQENLLKPWLFQNVLTRSRDFSKKQILPLTKNIILYFSKLFER